jgi:hypothetical protein
VAGFSVQRDAVMRIDCCEKSPLWHMWNFFRDTNKWGRGNRRHFVDFYERESTMRYLGLKENSDNLMEGRANACPCAAFFMRVGRNP